MPKLAARLKPTTLAKALELAAKRGNFAWSETDVLAAARKLSHPILLFHGANDWWIPVDHSREIKAAAPTGSELRVGGGDHLTISMRLAPMAEPVTTWFDRALTGTESVASNP